MKSLRESSHEMIMYDCAYDMILLLATFIKRHLFSRHSQNDHTRGATDGIAQKLNDDIRLIAACEPLPSNGILEW